jgi:hypothetical protein
MTQARSAVAGIMAAFLTHLFFSVASADARTADVPSICQTAVAGVSEGDAPEPSEDLTPKLEEADRRIARDTSQGI